MTVDLYNLLFFSFASGLNLGLGLICGYFNIAHVARGDGVRRNGRRVEKHPN